MDGNYTCHMHPDDIGLRCEKPYECLKCGWNPMIDKIRRETIYKKVEEGTLYADKNHHATVSH